MVMWAQRPNLIFLTVCLEDTKDPQIEVDTEKLYFKAVGGPEKKMHEVTINFHGEIDKEKSKFAVRDRVIEFALEKKEVGPYWPRLCKDKTKQHWLKIDFNKWRDEDDESDEEGGGQGQDLEASTWNSVMESMKRQTGDQNPADFLARSNEAMAKVVMENQLKNKENQNTELEKLLAEKEWDLAQKQAFMKENARYLH